MLVAGLAASASTDAVVSDPLELMTFEAYVARFDKQYPGNLSDTRLINFAVIFSRR